MGSFLVILYLVRYVLFQVLGLFIAAIAGSAFVYIVLRKLHSLKTTLLLFALFFGAFIFFYLPVVTPNVFQYPVIGTTYGPGPSPTLPFKNIAAFFLHFNAYEKVPDIARDPNDLPPPITRMTVATVDVSLNIKEVLAEIAPGIVYNYWTFDGKVPGPLIRVREGDTVRLSLTNDPTSLHAHSIDLHAVTGPGGGAAMTGVLPGQTQILTFKALNPGLYVYHCAMANTPLHMAHGMYGLILVEPKEGLPKVDKEFYIMQGELYTTGELGKKGLQIFDSAAMLDGHPQYIVFNGRMGGATGKMIAHVGQTVRFFVGNGGVNFISSFHIIGEIMDTVYAEGGFGGAIEKNIQTTLVPAGGSIVVELGLQVPGKYVLVDHALARIDRGAWGTLQVEGPKNPEIYDGVENPLLRMSGH